MKTFYIDAEVTLRGTIAIEAEDIREAQARVDAGDVTLIDDIFYATAGQRDCRPGLHILPMVPLEHRVTAMKLVGCGVYLLWRLF